MSKKGEGAGASFSFELIDGVSLFLIFALHTCMVTGHCGPAEQQAYRSALPWDMPPAEVSEEGE